MPAFFYWAYGLCLACDEPLGGLLPAPHDTEPDLFVWLEDRGGDRPDDLQDLRPWRPLWFIPNFAAWVAWSPHGPAFRLRYGTALTHIEFTITRSGSQIRTRRRGEGFTNGDVEAILMGSVLTCTLRARGATCLHGSVVVIDGLAVALLGEAEAGKSTTAAGLLRLGARLMADDLAVVVEDGEGFRVHHGCRRLRLHPDAAGLLGAGTELPRVWPDLPNRPQRRYLEPPEGVDEPALAAPLPLAAIYILKKRDPEIEETSIEPLSPARGLAALLSNASAPFMLPELGSRSEFDRLTRLARSVPIRAVRPAKGLEHLDVLCSAIRYDAVELVLPPELAPPQAR